MKGVQLTKMMQELELHNLTPEIDLTDYRVMTAEINRPALQLAGYLEHFANERVQIILFLFTGTVVQKRISMMALRCFSMIKAV